MLVVLAIGVWGFTIAYKSSKARKLYGWALSYRKAKQVKKMIDNGADWSTIQMWLNVNMSSVNYAHMVSTKQKCRYQWELKNEVKTNV